ncbi:PREDICTED: GLIPR1-like protein 1 [Miniopterus natalensis]|uniref:GLIPR1-like protein 1 n=1 Tax=Miniopterus natalensis TaxID=291302 RepID=UPI0007A6EE8C|nr:PREDICTED: GLIPR1-like protein 1 [Miniopterus natalensis]
MVLRNKLSCFWILGFCLVASKSPPTVPSINDRSFIDDCLAAHNEIRGNVEPPAADMKHMTWDEALAKTAKAWANQCTFGHNPCTSKPYQCHPTFKYSGENIWLGGSIKFTPVSAIGAWYNEIQFYNYSSLLCSKVCGHYTQVVWANSYKVGCAITVCPKLGRAETAIFICNYGPEGNYLKMRPYTKGESCSMCEKEDTCRNNLCENKELDAIKKYPNWNPNGKAPQQTACNLLCLVYALLRMF